MRYEDWLNQTNPKLKGIGLIKQGDLIELRNRVCERAGTNVHILINAKSRGSIGRDLITRLEAATKKEKLKILYSDHFED